MSASEYGSTTNAPPNIRRVPPSTASVDDRDIAASTPIVASCEVWKRRRYWKKKSAIRTTMIVAEMMISGAIAWKSQPGFMRAISVR